MNPVDENGARHDLREMLIALDDALATVVDQTPWADRDGNRVMWHDADQQERMSDPPPGAAALFELCSEVRMADVGVGWFVHPLVRRADDDPLVPRHVDVDGIGPCVALGSDGGGGWLVVTHDGRVWSLPLGRILDGAYEAPSGVSLEPMAHSVHELVALLRDRAAAAAAASRA